MMVSETFTMLGNHAPEKEGLFNSSMEENDMKDDS
jgi:hypothetical protein